MRWITPIVCYFFVFVSIFFFLMLTPSSWWSPIRVLMSQYILQSDYIYAKNQPLTDTIVIDSARLTKPGFLVIVTEGMFGGPDEYVIAASQKLTAGVHTGVSMAIRPKDFLRDPSSVPAILPGARVYVGIFYDDVNMEFTNTGEVARDAWGYPVLATMKLL